MNRIDAVFQKLLNGHQFLWYVFIKAHNSVKNQWIVTLIELDLCFDIMYQHAKYELNQCSLSKVTKRTTDFVLCFNKRPITPAKLSGL